MNISRYLLEMLLQETSGAGMEEWIKSLPWNLIVPAVVSGIFAVWVATKNNNSKKIPSADSYIGGMATRIDKLEARIAQLEIDRDNAIKERNASNQAAQDASLQLGVYKWKADQYDEIKPKLDEALKENRILQDRVTRLLRRVEDLELRLANGGTSTANNSRGKKKPRSFSNNDGTLPEIGEPIPDGGAPTVSFAEKVSGIYEGEDMEEPQE